MPSWNIHLEVGERLADKLHFSGKKRKEFLLGCILPDINNGYVNKVHTTKPHAATHYNFDKKSSLNFYAENQAEIDARNPIFLGYLLHLYTDGYFNYHFYSSVKHHDQYKNLTHQQKAKIKHHDFYIFDSTMHHFIDINNREEAADLAALANQIRPVDLIPEDIENVEKILRDNVLNDQVRGKPYFYYTEAELRQILDNMLESFSKEYLKGEKDA